MTDESNSHRDRLKRAGHRDRAIADALSESAPPTREDGFTYLRGETWKREGDKLHSVDLLLPDAVQAHLGALTKDDRAALGFTAEARKGGGIRLVMDLAKAEAFFAARGESLAVTQGHARWC